MRINIFQTSMEVILNIYGFQPQKILRKFLIYTLIQDCKVKIAFISKTIKSEPDDSYKRNYYEKDMCIY